MANKRRMRQIRVEAKSIATRSLAVDKYLNEVNREKMITPAQEVELAELASKGDLAAINKLATANLRFVISVAKQYARGDGALLSDLISQGNTGLLDAARTFDHTRGFKFISYAVWHIRKEILLYLNNNTRTVRLPVNFTQAISAIRKAEERLFTKLGREPDSYEVMEYLESIESRVTEKNFHDSKQIGSTSIPLEKDKSDFDSPKLSPIDWLSSDESAESELRNSEIKRTVKILMNVLNAVESDIFIQRTGVKTGIPLSYREIAEPREMHPESVRLIYERAMRKVKNAAKKMKITEV